MSFDPDSSRHVIVSVVDEPPNANGASHPESIKEPVRPQDMTAPELRKGEGDIIDDLFRSDERSKQEVGTVAFKRLQVRQFDADGNVKRNAEGEIVYGSLELRLRALRQSQIDSERRKCARVWQVGDDGQRENVFDPTELNSRVVALAMVPEDRARYLEDKRMWDHFGAGGPVDVIDKWLTAGELAQAGAMVMKLSGIRTDINLERLMAEPSSEVEAG